MPKLFNKVTKYQIAIVALLVLGAGFTVFRPHVVNADHSPLTTPVKWRNLEIQRMWATTFPDDSRRTRVRRILDHDPACYSGTCNNNNTTGSWARWFISTDFPHFDTVDNATRPDYDFFDVDRVCEFNDNRVSFHIQDLRDYKSDEGEGFRTLGIARVCPRNQIFWNCVDPGAWDVGESANRDHHEPSCPPGLVPVVERTEQYIGSGAVVFDSSEDGIFYYGGPGQVPPRDKADFMSVVTHELGHIYNLGHYIPDASGHSIDTECNGTNSNDMGESNSRRATMCIPIYLGTKRQVTPEADEKDTFRNLYQQ